MVNPDNKQTIEATSTSTDNLASQFFDKVSKQKEAPPRQTSDAWESWELDKSFFRALSQWELDNPEASLERTFDHIRDGLENSKDPLDLIPNDPFPARNLLIALSYPLKLGMITQRLQKDIYDFAKDVIRWIGLVKSAYVSARNGKFTRQAWRDFRHMRKLVDEICLWVKERLKDRRWLRIGHGLTIGKEIQEFEGRIIKARTLFQDLSSINTTGRFNAIIGQLHNLVVKQNAIIVEIREIRKTRAKQLERITSEPATQRQVAERERFFARTLNLHAIASPTYDTQGKRPCDEDTRIEVLDEIQQWRDDIRHGSPNFLWLTGDPGCGKSAVTASFARKCKDEGVLWAQFFINRNNVETTDPRSYFPSIARQLADYSTEVAKSIHHTLIKRRSLTDDISPDQAAYLFTSSIRKASELDPDRPVVVVIDGLDETKRNRLDDTAKIFSTLFTTLEAYSNVKVFISSRTENEIQKSFVLPQHDNHVKHIHLDTADPSSIRYVTHYIKRNLLNLVREHDLNWDVWPGEYRSRLLGQRASGRFIWGVTVIKFIQEQLYLNGKECLDEVLDMLTADTFRDINSLYMLNLNMNFGGENNDWEFERFRRILGVILSLREPICIHDLGILLDLRKTRSDLPVDIIHFIRRFRTILVSGTDEIDGRTIPRVLRSAREFTTSNAVNQQLRVDPDDGHLELGIQCLVQLGAARALCIKDVLPVPFRYASRFWLYNLQQTRVLPETATPICADYRSSSSTLSPSLSVSSTDEPIRINHSPVNSQINVVAERLESWDAVSGIDKFISHKGPVTCTIFSPDCKAIVTCSYGRAIKVWGSTDGKWMRTFAEEADEFESIAFSPDGKVVVSGSKDGSIRLWDYSSGASKGKPFRGHTSSVTCVAFSQDRYGEWVISGSKDKTCRLWNARRGQTVGRPWIGHRFTVQYVAFSATGQRVCSLDTHGNGRLVTSQVSYTFVQQNRRRRAGG